MYFRNKQGKKIVIIFINIFMKMQGNPQDVMRVKVKTNKFCTLAILMYYNLKINYSSKKSH